MKNAALLTFALALAACGGTRWDKPGAGDADATLDLSACRKLAQDRVYRLYGAPVPSSGIPPRLGTDASQPSPAERQMIEAQAVGACMRERGYKLGP